MAAVDASAWGEYGVAMVGAAAALAGLIFVAISINLREILAGAGLPGRAGEGVMTLVVVLLAAALLLVPEQGTVALGLEWCGLALGFWLVLLRVHLRARAVYEGKTPLYAGRIVLHHSVVLLLLIAGLAAVLALPGGLYWIVAATLWGILVGVTDAWVLMVEILR